MRWYSGAPAPYAGVVPAKRRDLIRRGAIVYRRHRRRLRQTDEAAASAIERTLR